MSYTIADIVNTVNKTAAKMGRSVNDTVTFTSKEFDAVHEWTMPQLSTLIKRGAVVVDSTETLSAKADFKAEIAETSANSCIYILGTVRGVFRNVNANVMDELIKGVGLGRAAVAACPKLGDAMAKYGIDTATLESECAEDGRYYLVRFTKLEPYTFKRNHYRFTLADYAAKQVNDISMDLDLLKLKAQQSAKDYARAIDLMTANLAALQDIVNAA